MEQPGIDSPRSIDRARIIRRSMRCFILGIIGLLPLVGVGVAYQALRLRREIHFELHEKITTPPAPVYALVGMLLIWGSDRIWGLVGDAVVCLAVLSLQAYHVWRRLGRERSSFAPGRRELTLGALFAYTGLSLSAWTLGIVVIRLGQALPSP